MKNLFICLLLTIFISGCNSTAKSVTESSSVDPVKTANGMVSGVAGTDGQVLIFKGIPFAAPPVGDLRWKEPQPVANWEGIKKCDTFGPNCIQLSNNPNDPTSPYTQEFLISNDGPNSEDCLYLNVWTGAKSNK